MKAGIDNGYNAVKAVGNGKDVTFPSAIGTPDKVRFSLNDDAGGIYLELPQAVAVGAVAVEQSRIARRREDRNWIQSDEWYLLALAALSELTTAKNAQLEIVTGLPVAFYSDKAQVIERLSGFHQVKREGRHAQGFTVQAVKVIPQPFGALLDCCLSDKGKVVDKTLAGGRVGIIDVGGKTCNLLAVNRLAEIGRETASVNVGGWVASRMLADVLAERCPGLDLRPHEVTAAIISRQAIYYGETVDLSEPVDSILDSLAAQVVGEASQVWNGAAGLSAILVSGGGALLLGDHIRQHFPHARVVSDPVFANARGFWKLAQRS